MKKGPLCRPQGQARMPPLRTFLELCSEHGVTHGKMAALMRNHPQGCPEPRIKHVQSSGSWYEPQEFRRWYASATGSNDSADLKNKSK